MLTLFAVALALGYLFSRWHGHYRAWQKKREEALIECSLTGHDIKRVHAFDDPRFPVDRCTRCHYQTPVRFPCPHCGKDIPNGRISS